MAMAHGNAVAAKKIRLAFTQMIDTIDGWGQNTPLHQEANHSAAERSAPVSLQPGCQARSGLPR